MAVNFLQIVIQMSVKPIIDNLRSANIATVIATGNDGFTNSISAPACISTSVSVGSTGDGSNGSIADAVSSFSNSAELHTVYLLRGKLLIHLYSGGLVLVTKQWYFYGNTTGCWCLGRT